MKEPLLVRRLICFFGACLIHGYLYADVNSIDITSEPIAAPINHYPAKQHNNSIFSSERLHIQGLVDLQLLFHQDPEKTWLKSGAQATRYGAGDNGLQLAQLGLELHYQISSDWHFNSSVIYYPEAESELAITEAFLLYKPVPRGLWRQQLRLGAFHLPISLENDGVMWSADNTITPSVINTWIAEELRSVGVEWRWQLPGKHRQSAWDFDFFAAIYGANDSTGAMLAWRGWAGHDRISGLNSTYPITPIPIITNGELSNQESQYDPYIEADERPGFYLGASADLRQRVRLDYFYYDNQANPNTIEGGQYAWHTRFHHLAAAWDISVNTKLLSQWIEGDTEMGRALVLSGFRAKYLMFVQQLGRAQLALRWEDFSTSDRDSTRLDTNIEDGESWTFAYAYLWKPELKTTLELKSWKSERRGRHYIPNQAMLVDAKHLILSLRYYY